MDCCSGLLDTSKTVDFGKYSELSKILQSKENIYLVCWDKNVTLWAELQVLQNQIRLINWLASCYGSTSRSAGTGRLVRIDGRMNADKSRDVLERKPSSECRKTSDWGKLSTWQQPEAYSHETAWVALVQVSECPLVVQPKSSLDAYRTSLERPEDESSQMPLSNLIEL